MSLRCIRKQMRGLLLSQGLTWKSKTWRINSKFKPEILDHYESIFIKVGQKNIFNSMLTYLTIFIHLPMLHKMLGARLHMISTLNLNVKLMIKI